ncbi:hypothetical protein GGR77_003251 [Xanthomonas translucens]
MRIARFNVDGPRMLDALADWLLHAAGAAAGAIDRNRAFFLAAAVTLLFYYPALRHGSLDAGGILYSGDVLGLYWPSMMKTHSLLAGMHFSALDFSQYNGSSDYFLAPNFFVLHPLFVLYCLLSSPEDTAMQNYGQILVWLVALHSFIACYFSLKLLMRFFGFGFAIAAFAATAFTFSMNMISAITQPQFIFCISVLPWAAYMALSFAAGPMVGRLFAAALPAIFGFLGGYVPLGVTSIGLSVVVVAATLLVLADDDVTLRMRVRRVVLAMLPYGVASVVVMPYLLAIYRHLKATISADTPSLFYSAHQLAQAPQGLLKLLSTRLDVPGPFYEFSSQAGLIAVVIFCLFVFGRDPIKAVTQREWRVIVGCLAIWMLVTLSTFGEFSVVSDLVYYFVPQVGGMHIYQRFLLPAHLLFAVVIAIMLRAVVETRPVLATKLALLVVGLLVLVGAFLVARSPGVSGSLGLNSYVLLELFLAFAFIVSLLMPVRGIAYGAAIALSLLPALDVMYDFSHGRNSYEARSRTDAMSLDAGEKHRFAEYLKQRFSDKAVLKYVDLTLLWSKAGREPFPKSFPYLVLNELKLSSYHGFDFRMGPRADYLQKMPMAVRDETWVLNPDWDLVTRSNADFFVAYESDLSAVGALTEFAERVGPDDVYHLPNGIVAVPLRATVSANPPADSTLLDNGFFRIGPTRPGPVNIARGKAVRQSGTLDGREARLAVDGNTNGDLEAGSISHTNQDLNAWLDIDLGSAQAIDRIGIWNVKGYEFRLHDYWVFVSEAPFGPADTADTLKARPGIWARQLPGRTQHDVVRVGGVQGRYVRVQLGGASKPEEAYLHLAEVEVFGGPAPAAGAATDVPPKLLDFETNFANYIRVAWQSDAPTTVQYLFSDNPNLRYTLNGKRIKPKPREGLITIDAPAGRNVLELRYRNWPLLVFWVMFALYGVLAALAWLVPAVRSLRRVDRN